MGMKKFSLKYHAGSPEHSREVYIGWGGVYEEKKEKVDVESVILEYIDSLPLGMKNREDAPVGEGAL